MIVINSIIHLHECKILFIIWASPWENLSSGVCEQHRRRPACAFAQSDQRLCYSLLGKYHMWTCYRWKFNFLASLCSWGIWFETRYVGNPEDRFSRDEAHMTLKVLWKGGWFKAQYFTIKTPRCYGRHYITLHTTWFT